ncbi:MAG: L-lactate dehydrogenase complex protein LldF [Chloroflexi bacterium]|jgi:L-lactate dehydrogenase complex protein LldF|nr:MAG: L-lactate dehydrogenase complex protein LldF [Chloroflexota bacterium]
MQITTEQFKQASTKALKNGQIQRSLSKVSSGFEQARRRAVNELTSDVWEQYREQARQIKDHTIENLDYYLNLLTDRLEHNGAVVHFAKDSKEANAIVLDVARSRGVKTITKSKSMVSEEIGLNEVLETNGIEPIETDLGEYILQLANETPFHLVAPALHKSKKEVADLFNRKLRTSKKASIGALTLAARRELRGKFLKADMGITGVNFAVAETGTIALFTNEGNGRMSTSIPRIHMALMGMEKVVPTLEDMAVMLRILPRAATGQRITSYVTLVSGPRRPDEEDGPEEFHLVVIDNGRSKLLRDPELREALNCIRCGACLNTCPVYQSVGGHAYGWVYPGPIGSIITPVLTGLSKANDLPFASTLCGACKDACPVKINIPRMLIKLRKDLKEGDKSSRNVAISEKVAVTLWKHLTLSTGKMAFARSLGTFLQRPLTRGKFMKNIPFPPFSKWTKYRDFPSLAPRSFKKIWEKRKWQ